MDKDPYRGNHSSACPNGKSGWSTEALLAIGFAAGLMTRGRIPKLGWFLAAGGMAWSMIRKSSRSDRKSSVPTTEAEFEEFFLSDSPEAVEEQATRMPQIEASEPLDEATASVMQSLAEFTRNHWESPQPPQPRWPEFEPQLRAEESTLTPNACKAPTLGGVLENSVEMPTAAAPFRPISAPITLSDIMDRQPPLPAALNTPPADAPAPNVAEATSAVQLASEPFAEKTDPISAASDIQTPQPSEQDSPVVLVTQVTHCEPTIDQPVMLAGLPEPVIAQDADTPATALPLADTMSRALLDDILESITPQSPAPVEAAEWVPMIVPALPSATIEAVPFHLEGATSAAWLLGLEPIPVVQDEPVWRKPLLAGVESAFETQSRHTTSPMMAAGKEAVIEIAQPPVATAAEPVREKPATRPLLGRVLEQDAEATTPRPSFLRPISQPLQPKPELVAAISTAESWLSAELSENKAHLPAGWQAPASAETAAARLAQSSPVRHTQPLENGSAEDGQKRKSWLGLWK